LVDVVWLGHACFTLQSNTSLLFDPFKGTGLVEPKVKADIVLCTHSHQDHNNAAAVKGENSTVLESFTGEKRIGNVRIRGLATFHDDVRGTKRGRNSIYVVELNNVTFCHLGDLGHELSASEVDEIGPVDVLFIPVGGFFTIGPQQARNVVESLKPRIAVPMHYKTAGLVEKYAPLKGLDDFLRENDSVRRLRGSHFSVDRLNLPEHAIIVAPRLA